MDLGIVGAKKGKKSEVQEEEKEKNWSFVEVAKAKVGKIGDTMWLQLKGRVLRSKKKQLGHCLVGKWEVKVVQCPNLDCLKTWRMQLWNLKERVSFSIVEGYLGK